MNDDPVVEPSAPSPRNEMLRDVASVLGCNLQNFYGDGLEVNQRLLIAANAGHEYQRAVRVYYGCMLRRRVSEFGKRVFFDHQNNSV
jgi:hypothetical protein